MTESKNSPIIKSADQINILSPSLCQSCIKIDILERLQNYNPPDRTYDNQRQIAEDIQDAIAEIRRLRGIVDAIAIIINHSEKTTNV